MIDLPYQSPFCNKLLIAGAIFKMFGGWFDYYENPGHSKIDHTKTVFMEKDGKLLCCREFEVYKYKAEGYKVVS